MNIVSDNIIMPDRYNTGIERGVALTDIADISNKYNISPSNNRLYLTSDLKNALLTEGLAEITYDNVFVIKTICFTETMWLYLAGTNLTEYRTYRFVNCKFDGGDINTAQLIGINLTTDNTATNAWYYLGEPLEFIHCEFTGSRCTNAIKSLTPTIFEHCYAHDFGSDAFPTDNPKSKRLDCYACKGGMTNVYNGTSTGNAHADFIQTAGMMDTLGEEFVGTSKSYIRRCRSDIIQYFDANGTYYLSNASSYNDCDYGNIEVDIDYMWASGGNYPYRFEISQEGYACTGKATNLFAGTKLYNITHISEGCNVEITSSEVETVLVGSVWTENNVVNVSVTNYTPRNRVFKIETNLSLSDNFNITASPQQSELTGKNGDGSHWFSEPVTWEDFPYDKLYTISSDGVEWIRVYDVTDGENVLVRTQVLNERDIDHNEGGNMDFSNHRIVSKIKLDAIADAIRTATASDNSYTLDEMPIAIGEILKGDVGNTSPTISALSENMFTGTFTIDSNSTDSYTIEADMNDMTPYWIVCIADEAMNYNDGETTYKTIGGQNILYECFYTITNGGSLGYSVQTNTPPFTELAPNKFTINPCATNYPFVSGWTYRWIAWAKMVDENIPSEEVPENAFSTVDGQPFTLSDGTIFLYADS